MQTYRQRRPDARNIAIAAIHADLLIRVPNYDNQKRLTLAADIVDSIQAGTTNQNLLTIVQDLSQQTWRPAHFMWWWWSHIIQSEYSRP